MSSSSLRDAVRATLAERGVVRKIARARSSSVLADLIFDDRGNPMGPGHANKKGRAVLGLRPDTLSET
jgi:hypothetical protein